MQLTFLTHFPLLLATGKVLSVISVALLLAAWFDVWRRPSFPDASYGGLSLSRKRIRWVWFLVLLGAFLVGIDEDPIAVSTYSMEDPDAHATAAGELVAPEGGAEAGSPDVTTKTVGLSLPTPFYRYERQRIYLNDVLASEEVVEGVLIPWALLWSLLAYWVLVVRWNPERGLARRILWGRRWKKEAAENRPD